MKIRYSFPADYKVPMARTKARRHGLPATLTQEEWRESLEYFHFKCAYCQTGSYHLIEHFKRIADGGGTTKTNCVPSCWSCNSRKDNCHEAVKTSFPQADLERVRKYLEALGVKAGDLIEDDITRDDGEGSAA